MKYFFCYVFKCNYAYMYMNTPMSNHSPPHETRKLMSSSPTPPPPQMADLLPPDIHDIHDIHLDRSGGSGTARRQIFLAPPSSSFADMVLQK